MDAAAAAAHCKRNARARDVRKRRAAPVLDQNLSPRVRNPLHPRQFGRTTQRRDRRTPAIRAPNEAAGFARPADRSPTIGLSPLSKVSGDQFYQENSPSSSQLPLRLFA